MIRAIRVSGEIITGIFAAFAGCFVVVWLSTICGLWDRLKWTRRDQRQYAELTKLMTEPRSVQCAHCKEVIVYQDSIKGLELLMDHKRQFHPEA